MGRRLQPIPPPENDANNQCDDKRGQHHDDESHGVVFKRKAHVHPEKAGNQGGQTDDDGDGGKEFHHRVQVV